MTPAMKQYSEIKTKYPDTVLFFRMGDFYETFKEDAYITSKILNIVITSREKGPNKTPMAGIPAHALNTYLEKMIAAGKKVAICEQMEEAKPGKGIVKRDIVKIITPGTYINENEKYKTSLILSAIEDFKGVCSLDIITGKVCIYRLDNYPFNELVKSLNPTEILLNSQSSIEITDFHGIITNIEPTTNDNFDHLTEEENYAF